MTKNLQLREKLPKKSNRERSTPSRINQEYGEKNLITGSLETEELPEHQTTSVEHYNMYLNNPTWAQESLIEHGGDHLASKSIAIPDNRHSNFYGNKEKDMRSSSLSSSKVSLLSELTSSNELIVWSSTRTHNGRNDWKDHYQSRYVNDRVEAELQEFKEEIDKKFKISNCKNFVFPRKTDVQKNHEHKSVHVYN
jgi:hypothetical protein